MQIPILTYHSANVRGLGYAENDHTALRADLDLIHTLGKRIVSLHDIVDWLLGAAQPEQVLGGVGISFDDGCDYDYFSRDFPGFGVQRGFREMLAEYDNAHATAFVLASSRAREQMDERALFGNGDMTTHWWREADSSGRIRIENHGWDHSHPDLDDVVQRDQVKGTFEAIDTYAECHQHVAVSAVEIARHSGRYPTLFAYPFGNSSRYMRAEYLPKHVREHGTVAAFSTAGTYVSHDSNRWDLPRFVCGHHCAAQLSYANCLNGQLSPAINPTRILKIALGRH